MLLFAIGASFSFLLLDGFSSSFAGITTTGADADNGGDERLGAGSLASFFTSSTATVLTS